MTNSFQKNQPGGPATPIHYSPLDGLTYHDPLLHFGLRTGIITTPISNGISLCVLHHELFAGASRSHRTRCTSLLRRTLQMIGRRFAFSILMARRCPCRQCRMMTARAEFLKWYHKNIFKGQDTPQTISVMCSALCAYSCRSDNGTIIRSSNPFRKPDRDLAAGLDDPA